jgi:hypothetical protein
VAADGLAVSYRNTIVSHKVDGSQRRRSACM